MKKLFAILFVLFAGTAVAEEKPGFTISPMVGYTYFDDGVDDDTHWSLGLGYQFDNPWAVEFVYSDMSADLEPNVGNVDFSRWHVDGLYHFNQGNAARPYLSFGLGKADYNINPGPEDDGSLLNLGVGVKWAFAENTSLRGEVKAFNGSDDIDFVNYAVSFGIHHVFGAAKAATAMSKPAPVAAAPMDSDKDGIMDDMDRCADTPSGAPIDGRGCPLDTDKDGVYDYMDACAGTTDRRASIDSKGCYVTLSEEVTVELNVTFDNDSSAAKPEHRAEVKDVYDFMVQYPLSQVTIEGHTDSRGSADYNRDLSQRRADTVASILINDFGIAATRVTAIGYGEERPIASNETAMGRQENRRVVGVVSAKVETVQKR